jgi:hypothetical protein
MSTIIPSKLLRLVLVLDSLSAGAMGGGLVLLAGPLSHWLSLPEALLRGAGIILLPFAALVAYLATLDRLPARAVWAVVIVNAIWAVDSVILLAGGFVSPNGLGVAFVLVQAVVVAATAVVQAVGVKSSEPDALPA